MFGICWERQSERKKQSFLVMRGKNGHQELVWVGKVHLLYRQSYPTAQDIGEFVFIQYIEVSNAVHGVEKALRCIRLRCTTKTIGA